MAVCQRSAPLLAQTPGCRLPAKLLPFPRRGSPAACPQFLGRMDLRTKHSGKGILKS